MTVGVGGGNELVIVIGVGVKPETRKPAWGLGDAGDGFINFEHKSKIYQYCQF
jgi:hypothetical protein